jgi:chromosome segregation protein
MKIKRLEIAGFKSFVEKAAFDFPAGVTAVVGPNGCGKSNVVDAIRWVMGEQSAKNLRGRQMEDVIFGGSESRKPLGMAEVSLVFSTEDGRVPAKYLNYSEVQVTRRLYRDGESEYLLNKTPCRLMDITELFMDTGVGARAYSIIEQGRIGMILMAKPEERRFLIEEAAGVTKYKSRKQIALKKIEATKQNLVRIGDIVGEIRRQLGSLHRQAKKAERFRAVREELRGIELFFASQRYEKLVEQRRIFQSEMEKHEQRGEEISAALGVKESDLETLRLNQMEEEQRLSTVQEEIFKARAELQGAENRLEFQKKEIAGLEARQIRLNSELEAVQTQISEALAEGGLLELRSRELATDSLGEEDALNVKERQLEEFATAERVASLTLEESRKRLFGILGEISQASNQNAAATKRLELLSERILRSASEEKSLKELLAKAQVLASGFESGLENERSSFSSISGSITVLDETRDALKKSLDGIELNLRKDRDELSAISSRLHSLQELEAQFAGYGQGVRTLMLDDAFKGRFAGLLADSIEVDEELEPVLEAVLGGRLQSLVTSSEATVHDAVNHLKNRSGGRCGFLLPLVERQGDVTPPRGAVALLSRLTVPDSDQTLKALLHGVMLVPDLETAISLSKSDPDLKFVTIQGDLAFGGGVVVGGSREPVQQGLIHKKREIRALAARKTAFEEQVSGLTAGRDDHLTRIAAAEKELQLLKQKQRDAELKILSSEKDLQRTSEEIIRLKDRLSLKAMDDQQLSEEMAHLKQELLESELRRSSSENLKEGLESEVARIQEDLTEKRKVIEAFRAEVTAIKVRAASLRERQESAAAALKKVEQARAGLVERAAKLGEEMRTGSDELERVRISVAESQLQLGQLVQDHTKREEMLASSRISFEESLGRFKREELLLKEIKGEEDELRRAASETSLKLSGLLMELGNIETQLKERYRMDVSEISSHVTEQALGEDQLAQRQLDLQKQVDEFGEVNLTAIDEYQELEQRHTFLSEQKADLEESLQSLQQAIQRINRTTRKRFAETFEQVNEKFKDVFPRLFCGGKAELKLTNEDDLLETGLDIIVQPPGKKLQNVSLLSGGEKALTAVALIFSIFLIKPSPFCLLDEVDAPLDDANIGRFNDMIREMSSFSQFILITHSKTTMAVADTLYGVTMEEPGVSKLVSVKLQ